MHQPRSTTVQFSVDEIKCIACQFLDVPQPSVLTVTPTEDGLSGSTTCILTHCDTGRRHVLKQLPLHLSIDHIRWTQSLAAFTRGQGYTLLPVAINRCDSRQGSAGAAPKIAIHADGTLWQCLEYIDGNPCKTPHSRQTVIAVRALANFHKVAKAFQMPRQKTLCGWHRRVHQLRSILLSLQFSQVENNTDAFRPTQLHELHQRFMQLIRAPKTIRIIENALNRNMSAVHQPALKDCWWDHVLFSNSHDRLTGIIDIDAAGWDDPAVDMSRLLGSWQLENLHWEGKLLDIWPEAFQQYGAIAASGVDFPSRVQHLHDTGILCGLDRWFAWIFTEKRQFPNMELVLRRITHLLHAAPAAIQRLE